MKTKLLAAFAVLLSAASPAFAHITLEVGQAPLGSPYKAVFRVPHGCDGAATTALRIQIPEGVIAVKPMPKSGWGIELKSGKYAKTYKNWGSDVSSGVTEVDFTGGNLPDAYYDEFVVTGTIADSFKVGDVIRFPVVQECGNAADRWIQVPAAGQKEDNLQRPAPSLTVTAATGSDD
jgi:periplasmic copper chaperone A